MEILLSVGIVVAAAVGFFFGRNFSSNEVEKNRLEQQLKDKTAELETFHAKVNGHFEKTAELFNHVSDSYQSLYDHMATSSTQLCATQTFQSLPKSQEEQSIRENPTISQQSAQTAASEEVFDANHLYNAHDYRNQEQQEEPEEPTIDDNKVVEIASAKEDSDAQALDYAIKEKGVINHNSLNIEGVKNS
ncbi:MAG: YhcB family protein [Kangiellaceae bacterium]|nr:YhcB family protein [Kangiellaceae bacterium]